MSRLVCFFSVGTSPKLINYTWAGRQHEARYMLDAAFHLGVLARDLDPVVFAPILTKETREEGDKMKTLLARSSDTWAPIQVDSAGPDAIERVLAAMLEVVRDGDRVFIEPTGGLRPFQMALIAGALYLRALRTEVTVERLVYGEYPSGAIHDVTSVLHLFDWTRDAHAFSDALSAGPLLARLRSRQRQSALDALEAPLAGGLAPQVFSKLRRFTLPEASSVAAREALALLRRRLASLKVLVDRTQPDRLDPAWLDAELAFVEHLAAAGRLGDATRALREWCVNVVLLFRGETNRWFNVKVRAPSEGWLGERTGGRKADTPPALSDLLPIYDGVQQLRNRLSHSGYQDGEQHVPPLGRARRYVERARTWWTEHRDELSSTHRARQALGDECA